MNPKPRAISFDLGDTLICYEGVPLNWASLYSQALKAVARACGIQPTREMLGRAEKALARYNARLNPRAEEYTSDIIFGEVLGAWDLASDGQIEPATDAFFSFFRQRVRPYKDSVPAIRELREMGFKIGILTDVPYGMPSRYVSADLGLIDAHVDVVLTSVEVGYRKPHPAAYLQLAQALAVAPEEMLYVGNESKDVFGANQAGAVSVLIDRSNHAPSAGEQHRISSLLDLPLML